ncbi:hypothetical protein E2C01_095612 [Portunus trituberculatus]|uniref:Uncharacterized protein n=1 Tax=Portunus trituberculatus TaxID=210409 RepID=A0A5B7K0S8_PORTR|nr:hypothetical protein [Portunus trituberculatus]
MIRLKSVSVHYYSGRQPPADPERDRRQKISCPSILYRNLNVGDSASVCKGISAWP